MSKRNYSTISHVKMIEFLKQNEDRLVQVGDIDTFLREEGLDVSPSTIYRYLNHLSEDGRLIKYAARKGEMSSFQYVEEQESSCREHLHLQCVRCHRIVHLDCGFMEEIASHIMSHHGFALECESSILYGVCEECRKGDPE